MLVKEFMIPSLKENLRDGHIFWLKKKCEGWAEKEKLMNSIVKSMALYGIEVWSPNQLQTHEKF